MKTSERGLAFMRRWETLALVAYDDGGGVWTLGYGHTKGVKRGDKCTTQQAIDWFAKDVGGAEAAVNNALRVTVTQNQFDALVSLCFNIGVAAFTTSTLIKKLNSGRDASNEFLRWTYDNRKYSEGLQKRRVQERMIYLASDESVQREAS